MTRQTSHFAKCFGLFGIRLDGSRTVVLGRMTVDEAKGAEDGLIAADFFTTVCMGTGIHCDLPTLE